MKPARIGLFALALILVLALVLWFARDTGRDAAPKTAGRGARGGEDPRPAPRKVRDFPRHTGIAIADLEHGADIDPTAPPHPFRPYLDLLAEVEAKLRGINIGLEAQDATLPEMLAMITERCGVTFLLDAEALEEAQKKIFFAVRELAAWHVLKLLLQQYDMKLVVSPSGELWVTLSGMERSHQPAFMEELDLMKEMSGVVLGERAPEPQAEATAKTREAVKTARVDLDFRDVPLPDVISSLQEATQLNVMINRRWVEDPERVTPTVSGRGMTVEEALAQILDPHGLAWRIDKGVLVVTTREEVDQIAEMDALRAQDRKERQAAEAELFARPVSFGGEDLAIRHVAEMLGRDLGVPVAVDPTTWARAARFSFDARPRPAREVVDALRQGAPVIVTYRDGTLWFLSPTGVK
ncbi:MAG: hypothetical protein HYY18_07180 [Planctomycetes bacterium]|nr:hypothetical protein [Planctomycetota bacterium]